MPRVLIIESEAGWGQRVEDAIDFDTIEEAEKYCRDYNTTYNPPLARTPDWYMYAKVEGHGPGMLRHETEKGA